MSRRFLTPLPRGAACDSLGLFSHTETSNIIMVLPRENIEFYGSKTTRFPTLGRVPSRDPYSREFLVSKMVWNLP